jgi:hypothetical protein
MAIISYRRHRFPPVVIQHAVWLYLRFTLSYRYVEELLAQRGLDISQRTSISRGGIASDAVQAGTNCVERLGFYREGLMSKRRGCVGIAALLFGVIAANMALAQKQDAFATCPSKQPAASHWWRQQPSKPVSL